MCNLVNHSVERYSVPAMRHSPGKRCYRSTYCTQEY